MPDRHISSVFDAELRGLVAGLMAFGGVCEVQLRRAAASVTGFDAQLAEQVLAQEVGLNAMELQLDRTLGGVIARRQPIARDLRLLLAIGKALANLERIGDEATKVARLATQAPGRGVRVDDQLLAAMNQGVELALRAVHGALDAFARQDLHSALTILRDDRALDGWFEAYTATLARGVASQALGTEQGFALLLAAKATERIGDHAKNVAELVIYAARGDDVRHMSLGEVEALVS